MRRVVERAEEVELYVSPWVSGTRAAAYYGPVTASVFIPDSSKDRAECWLEGEIEMMRNMQQQALELLGNSIVGLEVSMDPFYVNEEGETGTRMHAVGTVSQLEPLF